MSNQWANIHRRSIRLKGYDYSQPGAYFVTICTQDRLCLFGTVVDGAMQLDEFIGEDSGIASGRRQMEDRQA